MCEETKVAMERVLSQSDIPDSEIESNCSICLCEYKNKSYVFPCMHNFCFDCVCEWIKIKSQCPLCKQRIESVLHDIESVDKFETFVVPEKRRRHRRFGSYLINSYSFLSEVTPDAISDFASRLTGTDFINENVLLGVETARNFLLDNSPTATLSRSANYLNHLNDAASNILLNSMQRRYLLQRSVSFRPRSRRNTPLPHSPVFASSSSHNSIFGHQNYWSRIRAQRDDNARWWTNFRAQHRRLQNIIISDNIQHRISRNISCATGHRIANEQAQASGMQVGMGANGPIDPPALVTEVNATSQAALNGCPSQGDRVATLRVVIESVLDSLNTLSQSNPHATAVEISETNGTVPTNMPTNIQVQEQREVQVQVQGEKALILQQQQYVAQDQQPMGEDSTKTIQ